MTKINECATTTDRSVDYESLNYFAQQLYDAAHAAGRHKGSLEVEEAAGNRHTSSLLDIAERLLNNANKDASEPNVDCMVSLAAIVLSRTPLMAAASPIDKALIALGRGSWGSVVPTPDIGMALHHVNEAQQIIGPYR